MTRSIRTAMTGRARTVSRAGALVLAIALMLSLTPIGASAYVQPPIFRSQGTATEVADPGNPGNDVVKFVTDATPTGFASVTRDLRAKNLQVQDLTNMLSVKYFFVDRTCYGGSPRFQLNIKTGDGRVRNAWGYFGNKAWGGDCAQGKWVTEDLANPVTTGATWDLSSFGGPMTNTWPQVVDFFAAFPNHEVQACGVFDDSGWAAPAAGTVYLDNIQCHDRVLEDHQDVSPGTNAPF